MATRALLSKVSSFALLPASSRSFSTRFFSTSPLIRLRPLIAPVDQLIHFKQPVITSHGSLRCMSTHQTNSSLRDSSPNFSNRPPKETILLDGCDFEHWLIVMDPPPGDQANPDITRDEIIDSYIKTLAQVVGSEEEARMKIYSVSTRHYFAFGALVSEELSYKIKELPHVRWVLPDSYLDVRNKDYGGEPFINGEAVPYDPKYHDEWLRNNARANERSRRNDRPRNFDRSRNFERRRENMQTYQNPSPLAPPSGFNNAPPRDMTAPPTPATNNFNNMPPPHVPPPPSMGGGPPPPSAYQGGMPGTYRDVGAPGGYPNQQMPPPNLQQGYDRRPAYQGPPRQQGYGNPNVDQGNGYQGGGVNNGPGAYQGGGEYQGGGNYQGGGGNQPERNHYQGGRGGPQMGGGNGNFEQGQQGGYGEGGGRGGGGAYNQYPGRDMPGRDYQ